MEYLDEPLPSGFVIRSTMFTPQPITQITRTLWLGGCNPDQTLSKDFKHVISLYLDDSYQINHDLKTHLRVKMADDNSPIDRKKVLSVARFANYCINDGLTLIHCHAGLNRSAMIAAIALILDGMDRKQAIRLLRDKRNPMVLSNAVFERFVLDF